jgi:hypothetical protein
MEIPIIKNVYIYMEIPIIKNVYIYGNRNIYIEIFKKLEKIFLHFFFYVIHFLLFLY